MKKLLLGVVLALLFCNANAQSSGNGNQKELDYLLRDIDQSTVTSGIIYERTLQLANLYNYNREEYSNTADFSFFRQSLLEMHRASNEKLFISTEELDKRLTENEDESNIVHVGILNTQFHILNYNEAKPEDGGLILDTVAGKFIQKT
jgi:hypothetical protein